MAFGRRVAPTGARGCGGDGMGANGILFSQLIGFPVDISYEI